MSKLVRTLLAQSNQGTIIYQVIETPEGLENSKINQEIRAMINSACQENIEDRKKTDPTYNGGAVNIDDVIRSYFEHGVMFIQSHEEHLSGFAIISISEGKKEADILELYVTQTYRNQNFENLFIEGILQQLSTTNIKSVVCTISAVDEKMVDVLSSAKFEPETAKFRYICR